MSKGVVQSTVRVLLLAVLYFVTGRLGLLLPTIGPHITLIWLPTGIAVAALLRCNFHCWPGIALGAAAVNIVGGIPWLSMLGIAVGNTVAPMLAAWILQRTGFHTALDRKRDILFLTIAAVLGTVVSATMGVQMLALAGALSDDPLAPWLTWWAGDAMGVITAAPLLLSLDRQAWRAIKFRRVEFLLCLCATGLAVFGVFLWNKGQRDEVWALSFLPLPLVAWAALRFGAIGTSLTIIMLSVGAACGLRTGRGPLYRADPSEGAIGLWLFMATASVLGWLITALHAARLKATSMQQLLEEALNDVSLGVLLGNADQKITYANMGFTRLTGYTEEELLGQSCRILQGPGTDPVVAEKLMDALRGDGHFDGEILTYRKNGTPFWNAVLVSPVHNERGEMTGLLGIQRDVTTRRESEAAIRESEDRFRRLIDHAPEAIVLMDAANGRFIQANPAAEKLFKLSAAELCKVGPLEMSPRTQPDGRDSNEKGLDLIARALAGDTPVFEWTHRNSKGSDIPCEVRLLRFEIGGRTVVRGSVTDITARRKAEEALNASVEFSNSLIRSMQDGFALFDNTGVHLDANPAFCRMTGFSREELIGVGPPYPYWPPEDRDRNQASLDETFKGNFPDRERVFMRRTGERFPVIVSPSGVKDAKGEFVNYLVTVKDITGRKHAEEKLRHSEERLRMALAASSAGTWSWDVITDCADWDDQYHELYGIAPGAARNLETWLTSIHPDDRARLSKRLTTLLESKDDSHWDEEFRAIHPAKGERWMSGHGKVERDSAGRAMRLVGINLDVTARKRVEEALRESEERLRFALGTTDTGMWDWDVTTGRGKVTPENQRIFGLPEDILTTAKETYEQLFHPDDVERLRRAFLWAAEGRGSFDVEYRIHRADDGAERWLHSVGRVVTLSNGDDHFIGITRDITARKRAEEALQMADQKLKLHIEQTPMAVIEWDLAFRVTQWNPAAERIFGYSRDEVIGQHGAFFVPEPFREHVDQVWQALTQKAGGERSSNENIRKDGTIILCEWYNTPLVDAQGTVAGVASLVMDITERRNAQQLLAWEKSAMELISSPGSLGDVLDGVMCSLEKQAPGAFCSVLLLDDDGIHLRHGAAPSLPEAYNRAIDGLLIGAKAGSCGTAAYENRQVIVADVSKSPLWEDYRELALEHGLHACWSTPIHGSTGRVLGTFAIYYREARLPVPAEMELIMRVTHIIRMAIEHKHAEEALRESEEKFRTLFENAGDAIFLMQGDQFIDCNARTLEVFGCTSRDQIVGHPPYEFSPPSQADGRDSRQCAIEKITAAIEDRPQVFEWMHTKLDGSPFPAEVSLNKVVLGGQVYLQAIVRDISDRKQAEAEIRALNADLERRVEERTGELQAANKELEAFSYSVSHDLRAPLRAIDGFSRIVAKNYAERLDDEGRKLLTMIRGGAQQMGRLIGDLLTFSRLGRQPLEPEAIDMHAMARKIFDDLAALDSGRTLRLTLHPLPPVRGTKAMIRQVWVNLISNAIKFTNVRDVAEIEIGARTGADGAQIYYVKDNGAGFDMEHADRLFGVFQRLHTTEEFEGTGVGLALVQRIVQRHGGCAWAEGEVGRGATFSFTLFIPKT